MTDFDTGVSRYVSAADGLDPFEVLRATAALPVFFGKKVLISGNRYIDGEIGPVLEDHIDQALEQGADRILIINHSTAWTPLKKAAMKIYASSVPEGMHNAIIRDISHQAVHIRIRDVAMISVAPHNLRVGTTTRNPEKLRKTFEQGVENCLAIKDELRTLFTP